MLHFLELIRILAQTVATRGDPSILFTTACVQGRGGIPGRLFLLLGPIRSLNNLPK